MAISWNHLILRFPRLLPQTRNDNQLGYLFLAEGHAVRALIHGGVAFVGANQDSVQSAVVGILAVVSTLLHGAFNALVCFAIHCLILLF